MAHDDPDKFREIIRWSEQRTWTIPMIREFYINTDHEDFPIPERLGQWRIPTNDTLKYFCRYWYVI